MREYGYDAAFLRQIAPPTLCLWGRPIRLAGLRLECGVRPPGATPRCDG